MPVYNLLSTAVPPLQVPTDLIDPTAPEPVPTNRMTVVAGTGGNGSLSVPFNENATKDDAQGRYGGGAYAIWTGLDIVPGTFPNFQVTAGQAGIDGPVTVPAPVTLSAINNTRNWIWMDQHGVISIVTGSTTPPAGYQVFLGSINPAGGVFDTPDYSGRPSQCQGNMLLVQTADALTPAWTPPPWLRFFHQTAAGLYLWDGVSYHPLAGGASGGPPSGSAGGDLTGSYPNPALGAGVVTNAKAAMMASGTLKGNATGALASAQDLNSAAVSGMLGGTDHSHLAFGDDPRFGAAPPTGPVGGDLTGTLPNPTIAGHAVSNAKLAQMSGATLKGNAAAGVADAADLSTAQVSGILGGTDHGHLAFGDDPRFSGSPPTGAAGGDLAGSSYPNPVIAGGVVNNAKLANMAASSIKGNSTGAIAPATDLGVPAVSALLGGTDHSHLAFGDDPRFGGSGGSGPPTGAAGGDLGGSYPNPSVLRLNGSALPTNAGNGFLKRNSGNTGWEEVGYANPTVANTVCAGDDARLSNSRTPSGATGPPGDLTGTYPNPTIAGHAVTNPKLAQVPAQTIKGNSASSTSDAADLSVSQVSALLGGTDHNHLAFGDDARFGMGGPPTGAAGGDLAGSTYPNPVIAAGAVQNAKLANMPAGRMKGNNTGAAGPPLDLQVSDVASLLGGSDHSHLAFGDDPRFGASGAAGGDLAGSYPNPNVAGHAVTNAKLAQMPVATLKGNNTGAMADAADLGVAAIASMLGGTDHGHLAFGDDPRLLGSPPTGAAGGDLAGSYPNPTVALGAVTNVKLAGMGANTLKGNNSGGPGQPLDLQVSDVAAMLGGTDHAHLVFGDDPRFVNIPTHALTASVTTYTLAASDVGKMVETNAATAVSIVIDHTLFAVGDTGSICQMGSGQILVSGAAGTTLLSSGGRIRSEAQYATLSWRKQATGVVILSGETV